MTAFKILLKSVLSILICGAFAFAGGCGGLNTSVDGSGSGKESELLSNSGNITLYRFDGGTVGAVIYDDDWYSNFLNYYQKEYGGTVSSVSVEWEGWEDQFNTDLASGTAPDLIYLFEKNYINLLNRGLLVSVEEMTDNGVVGFDHPALMLKQRLAADLYSTGGKNYAFACAYAEADMIFVNEDLFALYGVTSPYQYYTEGYWNIETFMQCVQSITCDTDGDSDNDIYGYYGFDPYSFIASAGGDLIKLDGKGNLVSNVDSQATLTGLKNYRNVYSNGYATDLYSQWIGGKTAMVGWLPQNEYSNLANNRLDFNWSVVPFPLDKGNTEGICPGKCYGWAVTSPSVNWQGCVNYVIALNTYSVIEPDSTQPRYSSAFSTSQLEMFSSCADNIRLPLHNGVGELKNTQWNMWGALSDSNNTFDKAVDSVKKEINSQLKAETQN